MIEAALDYIRREFPVCPLHTIRDYPNGRLGCTCGREACSSPGKHPRGDLAPNGLQSATVDEGEVRRWWACAPNANIAVVTGRAIVLDIDPRHGGDDSLASLERQHEPLPTTWRSITGGGGEHVFFAPPRGIEVRNSANVVGPGVDVRGVGGYVVAAPSRHASGRAYAWSVDHHPDDVALAPMPLWLVQLAMAGSVTKTGAAVETWRKLASEGVQDGGRNNGVAKLSGHLLRRYIDPVVAHELIQAWNTSRCRPPLDPAEVTKTFASICRKEQLRQEAARGGR